jgi:hypothetical protein
MNTIDASQPRLPVTIKKPGVSLPSSSNWSSAVSRNKDTLFFTLETPPDESMHARQSPSRLLPASTFGVPVQNIASIIEGVEDRNKNGIPDLRYIQLTDEAVTKNQQKQLKEYIASIKPLQTEIESFKREQAQTKETDSVYVVINDTEEIPGFEALPGALSSLTELNEPGGYVTAVAEGENTDQAIDREKQARETLFQEQVLQPYLEAVKAKQTVSIEADGLADAPSLQPTPYGSVVQQDADNYYIGASDGATNAMQIIPKAIVQTIIQNPEKPEVIKLVYTDAYVEALKQEIQTAVNAQFDPGENATPEEKQESLKDKKWFEQNIVNNPETFELMVRVAEKTHPNPIASINELKRPGSITSTRLVDPPNAIDTQPVNLQGTSLTGDTKTGGVLAIYEDSSNYTLALKDTIEGNSASKEISTYTSIPKAQFALQPVVDENQNKVPDALVFINKQTGAEVVYNTDKALKPVSNMIIDLETGKPIPWEE